MKEWEKVAGIIKEGGIGILATDTIYGLVGSALSPKVVSRIYKIKKRNKKKPFIILISSLKDLSLFGIKINKFQRTFLKKIWPGKISVIFPCPRKKFFYLHRGKKSLAFRVPKKKILRLLLEKTGPLVAPSANLEGQPSVKTLDEAKKLFKNQVDFYFNGGKISQLPSTLIALNGNHIVILRKGAGHLPPSLLK